MASDHLRKHSQLNCGSIGLLPFDRGFFLYPLFGKDLEKRGKGRFVEAAARHNAEKFSTLRNSSHGTTLSLSSF
jgi:hypothetical protein